MVPAPSHLSAIVLAGGSGSRMGMDKAALLVNGEPMLARIVRLVQPLVDETVIAGPPRSFEPRSCSYVHDELPGAGPLCGLVSGLQAITSPHALVIACDAPLLSVAMLNLLHQEAIETGAEAILGLMSGLPQPLPAIVCREARDSLSKMLRDPQHSHSMRRALLGLTVHLVLEPALRRFDPDLNSFFSVNTPDDVSRVDRVIRDRKLQPAGG